jgi:hypothetical protein
MGPFRVYRRLAFFGFDNFSILVVATMRAGTMG